MDLGDMIRRTVQLTDEDRKALAQACEIKANALQELRDKLWSRLGDKTRVSLDDVIKMVDSAVADYNAGTDPEYWNPKF